MHLKGSLVSGMETGPLTWHFCPQARLAPAPTPRCHSLKLLPLFGSWPLTRHALRAQAPTPATPCFGAASAHGHPLCLQLIPYSELSEIVTSQEVPTEALKLIIPAEYFPSSISPQPFFLLCLSQCLAFHECLINVC